MNLTCLFYLVLYEVHYLHLHIILSKYLVLRLTIFQKLIILKYILLTTHVLFGLEFICLINMFNLSILVSTDCSVYLIKVRYK